MLHVGGLSSLAVVRSVKLHRVPKRCFLYYLVVSCRSLVSKGVEGVESFGLNLVQSWLRYLCCVVGLDKTVGWV